MRLEDIPFSFDNLSVLDIGCNQGGMLYELSNRIKFGVGVDYDSRMINVANKMKSHCKLNNLDYFVFDLEKENLDYLSDFLPEDKVDVVFLLSICMWIENWREVVAKIPTISRKLIFESNGKPEQQQEQIDELKKHYKTVQLIREKSTDDPSQKNRQLFYCTNEEG
jgi:SAM-dependent methyltransferase